MSGWTVQLLIDCDIAVTVRCACQNTQQLNLATLKDKLGPDAQVMHSSRPDCAVSSAGARPWLFNTHLKQRDRIKPGSSRARRVRECLNRARHRWPFEAAFGCENGIAHLISRDKVAFLSYAEIEEPQDEACYIPPQEPKP